MAGVPAINIPYIAPASRRVDGLPPDPSTFQAHPMQTDLVYATIFPGEAGAASTAPASPSDHLASLRNFLKATCAILPGANEDTTQRVECPEFTWPVIKLLITKYKTFRFNTSETNNFNCLLKELVTHHDFTVDQHNYARISKLLRLLQPASETMQEQLDRFQMANDFEIVRYDALRRLDALFEARKEELYGLGDAATEEVRRLNNIHQKLKVAPDFVALQYNSIHELPQPKLHFSDMDPETRRTFFREHWEEFQLATYWKFRYVFDIKATFLNPVMNRFGREYFVRQAESAWSNYLSQQLYSRAVTGPVNKGAFWQDMLSFPREYNTLVENDPKLGPDYCVKDISLIMVPRGSLDGHLYVSRPADGQ